MPGKHLATNQLNSTVDPVTAPATLYPGGGTPPAYWAELMDGAWRFVAHATQPEGLVLTAERTAPATCERPRLTRREREVVALTVRAIPSKVIAYDLGISPSGASKAFKNALTKLGLRSRVELLCVHQALTVEMSGAANQHRQHVREVALGNATGLIVTCRPASSRSVATLTGVERDVADAWIEGFSMRAIARGRGVSLRTIANQVSSVYRKLHVGSRVELLMMVRRANA